MSAPWDEEPRHRVTERDPVTHEIEIDGEWQDAPGQRPDVDEEDNSHE